MTVNKNEIFFEALEKSLSVEKSEILFDYIMSGEFSEIRLSAILSTLRSRGETIEEIIGATKAMRKHSKKIISDENTIDIVGTGGDGMNTLNISTASSLVVASTGMKVAKHGNRKMSSMSGSADILEEAGVKLNLLPDQISQCIREVGIGFIFAQTHHSAMKYAAPVRTQIGARTIMNILGPLTNPASAKNQVIGIFDSSWQTKIAEVLRLLGAHHVLIVHSEGLDEIGLEKPTSIIELKEKIITKYRVTPSDFGIKAENHDRLIASSPAESLKLLKKSLTKPDTAPSNIVSMNAGAAIYASGVATSLENGVIMAQDAIASGLAYEKFNELVRVTQLMANS